MNPQPPTGKPSSLTSIAFQTGVVMERQRLARIIKRMAHTWKKPTALNYKQMLQALAEQIESGELK
jgi:transposase